MLDIFIMYAKVVLIGTFLLGVICTSCVTCVIPKALEYKISVQKQTK